MQHLFCSLCGIKSFYVPRSHPDGYSANVRCIDEGTIKRLTVHPIVDMNTVQRRNSANMR